MNASPITPSGLADIEAALAFARSKKLRYVRVSDAIAETFAHGPSPDFAAHELAGELFAKYGRTPIYNSYSLFPNVKHLRQQQSDVAPDSLWLSWKADESAGWIQDCHSPQGIYPWLWKPGNDLLQGAFDAFCNGYFNAGGHGGILEFENEIGDTVDERREKNAIVDKVYKPTVEYLRFRLGAFNRNGFTLCAPPLANTSIEQVRGEDPAFWGQFDLQAINFYHPWAVGMSATSWATDAYATLRSFIDDVWWPGRPVVVSELGAYGDGLTASMRGLLRQAFSVARSTGDGIVAVCWYDFSSSKWGVK